MSFGKSKSPRIAKQEPIEEVEQVQEDETVAGKQEKRKRILSGGKSSTVLSGINIAQLKRRLGE